MEAPKEDVTTRILKGKRTKRQRAQSPIPVSLGTNSLSGEEVGTDQITNINIDPDGALSNSLPSPTTANANHFQYATTLDYLNHQRNEDEDMAHCLILLAQGGHSRGMPKLNDGHFSFQDTRAQSNVKFNSRRFLETGSTSSGKAGYYVYECKTCGKTFPSFQALGGHRASHKKPKDLFSDEKKRPATPALSSDDEDVNYKKISSLSLQLSNTNFRSYKGAYKVNKMHECGICGTEFASGQALGGHMRRHRAVPVGVVDPNSNLSLAPTTSLMETIELDESIGGRNELSLELDLNLPAPQEGASLHSNFRNEPQQELQNKKEQEKKNHQQQHPEQHKHLPIVISSPTLVDCHY